MATRTKFLKQLDDMQALLGRLGDKAASDTRAAGLAAAGDKGAETGILEGRKAAERLRSQIESLCLDIMLMQQPLVGADLRFVSASFRIVSDLAQVDSMTRDVAFIFSEMPDGQREELGERFCAMSEYAATMVERAVEAFCASNEQEAQAVIDADDKLDADYAKAEARVVELIRAGEPSPASLPELLMVAKYFERIGDKAQHVADWTFFRTRGERMLTPGGHVIPSEEA